MANKYWLQIGDHLKGVHFGDRSITLWVAGGFPPYTYVLPMTAEEVVRERRCRPDSDLRIVKDGEDIHTTFRERGHL